MRIKSLLVPVCILVFFTSLNAQTTFSKADYLHGKLTPERTCFDVRYQDISVRVMPDTKSICVSNTMLIKMVRDSRLIQLDLFEQMLVDSIVFNQQKLIYKRELN